MIFCRDRRPRRPAKTNAYCKQKRAIRESPLRNIIKTIVGDDVLGIPKTSDYRTQWRDAREVVPYEE